MGEMTYKAGLYLRLSNDDSNVGESTSIENQRLLLRKYAEERGIDVYQEYIDDGYSGTSMNRPAFQRMLRDAEDKIINMIIVKDLSRAGRNYIEVGRLTEETLPRLGCRFVALNDSVDSIMGENDMMVYRNLFNEFFSKDTSKKVRAVKQACMKQGKFMGTYAPLGYKKDPLNKHRLVIDEETAHIVRRIFELRLGGASARSIATTFNEERVPSPRAIYYNRAGRSNTKKENGLWGDSCIKLILRNEVYIGHMVQGKSGTISYKNHKQVGKDREQWVRVEHTHEPLVSLEDWAMVQELREKAFKPRKRDGSAQSMFVGILKCGDCGFNHRALVQKDTRKDGSVHQYLSFMCGNYARSGKPACSVHSIREDVLTEIVTTEIRAHAALAAYDEKRVIDAITKAKDKEAVEYLAAYKRELKAIEARLEKLVEIVALLFEDKINGVVPESMFALTMARYEKEREEKTETALVLRLKINACEKDSGDAASWVKLIRKYANMEALTQKALLELIDRIDVFEAVKVGNRRVCRVNIVYRFVGNIGGVLAGGCNADDGKAGGGNIDGMLTVGAAKAGADSEGGADYEQAV